MSYITPCRPCKYHDKGDCVKRAPKAKVLSALSNSLWTYFPKAERKCGDFEQGFETCSECKTKFLWDAERPYASWCVACTKVKNDEIEKKLKIDLT